MDISLPAVQIDPVRINRVLRPETMAVIVRAAQGVLIVVSIGFLGLSFYDFLQNRLQASTAALRLGNEISRLSEDKPQESGRRRRKIEIETASVKNLFGDLTPKTPVKDITPQKAAPQTQLALVGTFIADDVHESYAIIEDQKKKVQEDFSLNEQIFGEAKLLKIYSDKVEIERNGAREILKLDETADSGPATTEAGLPIDEFTVPEAELEAALQNLPLLLTQARAVPYFKGGQSVGLRLFAIKTGSLYEKVGLKNGDILKAINGNSLSDITQAAKLFETLKQEKNIGVTVERNREERVFRYQIR